MKRNLMVLAMLFIAALPVRSQVQIPPNIVNAGSTGTSANQLVKLTGTPSTAVISSAGDTQGILGICDANCGTSGFPNIATQGVDICAFDGATTAGDYVQISATTAGDCHDTGSAAVPTSNEIIGRVLASIGSAGNASVLIAIQNAGGGGGSGGVGSGSTGQAAAYNSSSTVTSIPLAIYPDALASAGGVGATPTAWAAATTYPLCQSVSSSGNYIAVSAANNNITPGSNSHIWYPVPNGSRSTPFDCAGYIALSQTTSTVAPVIQLGAGVYNSCIGLNYPTVASPGLPLPSIRGVGKKVSGINQTCTKLAASGGDGLAMINIPPAAVNSSLPSYEISDLYIEANALAVPLDMHACQQAAVRHVDLRDGAIGDHFFEAGTVGGGSRGWCYELTMDDVTANYNPNTYGIGNGNGAFAATVTVSGGVPTITVTNAGSAYASQNTIFRLVKAGGLEACTSVGTFTPTFSGSTITAVSTTSTGCAATGLTFLQIYPQINVNYAFTFSNISDSNFIAGLVPGGIGQLCGINISNTSSFNKFYNLHPIATFNGVCNQGTNDFYSTQLDTIYNWGFDEEGQSDIVNLYSTKFEWAASNLTGSSDYHFGKITNPPVGSSAAVNIFGDACGNTPSQSGYGHLVSSQGVIDNSNISIPTYLNIYQTQYCNQKNTNAIQPTNIAANIIWSDGQIGNNWTWNIAGAGGNNTIGTLTNSLGTASSPWSLIYKSSVAATSGANVKGPVFAAEGAYWDGSISQLFGWQIAPTCAAGTGPLCTFAFASKGTEPSGGHKWTFDAPVTLPTGSLAVTQSTGDTSTDVATDAFVANSIAAGPVGCTPSGTAGTVQASNGSGACQATALADAGGNVTSTEPILAPSATLGTSGTSVGSVAFNNATSGSITVSPTTGALGSVTATLPANTGTLAETNLAQTWTAAQTNSTAGAASTPALSLTGAPYTGGSTTTNTPLLYLNSSPNAPSTWSANGTMFGANAPTGFTGNLFNFFTDGGSSLFSLGATGQLTTANSITAGGTISTASTGSFTWTSRSKMGSPSDGTIVISNNAVTGFSQLNFGGSGAGSPALVVSGTSLSAKLANNSGFAPFLAAQFTPVTYSVSGLPSASTAGAGAMVVVTDATSFTPGTCTGGGSDYMIAVSNGTAWSCH